MRCLFEQGQHRPLLRGGHRYQGPLVGALQQRPEMVALLVVADALHRCLQCAPVVELVECGFRACGSGAGTTGPGRLLQPERLRHCVDIGQRLHVQREVAGDPAQQGKGVRLEELGVGRTEFRKDRGTQAAFDPLVARKAGKLGCSIGKARQRMAGCKPRQRPRRGMGMAGHDGAPWNDRNPAGARRRRQELGRGSGY